MKRLLVVAALAGGVLAGCSAGPGPLFDNEGGGPINCMKHQADEPGPRYTDPSMRNTGETLTMMRYYTANGAKPYCDGQPPAEADRTWARTFVDLGGNRAKVAAVLG